MPYFMEDYNPDLSLRSDTHLTSTQTTERYQELPQTHTQRAGSSPTPDPESSTERIVAAVSKKRKRGGMLDGLDMNNIIEVLSDEMEASTVEDGVSWSSLPVPPRKTRGSANNTRALLYDQKYHPLDEVLRPSQAARRRAEYGLEHDDEINDDGGLFKVRNHGDSDSESDAEGKPQPKRYKKLDEVSTRRSTRRSSRKAGPSALYNTNVHPQDSQLALMSIDEMTEVDDEDLDMFSARSDITNGSASQVNARTRSNSREEPEEVTHRFGELYASKPKKRMVQHISDDASDSTVSSPFGSTPEFSLRIYDENQPDDYFDDQDDFQGENLNHGDRPTLNDACLEQTPFEIYEEPIEEQLAKEALAPPLPELDHDDKENRFDDFHVHQEAPNGNFFRPNDETRATGQATTTHDTFISRFSPSFEYVDDESSIRYASSTSSEMDSVRGSPVRRGVPTRPL